MFSFEQNQNQNLDFDNLNHLLDVSRFYQIDTSLITLDSLTEQEQITDLETMVEQLIAAKQLELEQSMRHTCDIGPYANRICTICGGNQP